MQQNLKHQSFTDDEAEAAAEWRHAF